LLPELIVIQATLPAPHINSGAPAPENFWGALFFSSSHKQARQKGPHLKVFGEHGISVFQSSKKNCSLKRR
jgi:hypothetical protein